MRRLMYEARAQLASPVRNPRMATVIGRLLGLAFLLCFGTGLYSHFLQQPLPWMTFPTRPVGLYQVSQGTHIIAGIACFPLLLAKLYVVFPQLFQYPPVTSFANFLERASIALFVGASLVEITIGLLNTYQWYPFPFPFKQVHFALAFVIVGSLLVHIGVKLPLIAAHWRAEPAPGPEERHPVDTVEATSADDEGLSRTRGLTGRVLAYIDSTPELPARTSRRGFLATVALAVAAVVGLTAGQTFAPLDAVNVFGPRKKGVGQQGVPVNRTSAQAKVATAALSADWVLTLAVGDTERSFSRADLAALPQTDVDLPIACVEGWSQMAAWRGVRLRDLVDAAGGSPESDLRLISLEQRGGFKQTEMGSEYVRDPLTLVALELNGEILDLEHGYPARMIAPGRPGVLQTKWLSRIEAIDA
ncbi:MULTISPECIES: molybdopterin-dependent oxidoreductase [Cryobacterium]|uniref:molybdopterin-dependent oxidoreductase n=2 Tax=Microbacteriaceae TaxID=85023 RepID=UPI000B4C9097|nr:MULTISPECIES: molybdopterin-dependent oxidoreductase [Cryobacterium]ASD21227.1 molybdopterin-binding protein [Cryobacterium sp. LW097]TFC56613.1 twin-arginine translocation signal domain-containing protein [Cryobacterium sp. TMB1-7]TFC71281.1 twin-arginine translocation signal domain-containing protein [Cryobacterium sp. TMB3-15]TFC88775.1 twin-arginine translocation signal domain-containing protein [Cryobacterium sp. TMT4-31]POH69339.1 molybdopterin-binding protein [Cryobacterium zongtaii]